MATNVLIAALGVGTGLLSARLLGPQGRGELAAIQLWPTQLAAFAMLGLDSAVVYSGSRYPHQAGQYLASAVTLILMASVVLAGSGWWLMPLFLHAQSGTVIAAARLFLLGIVTAYLLVGMPHQVLRAVGAWRAWNLFRVLQPVGWLVALLATLALRTWATPVILSRLFLVASLVVAVPVAIATWRCVPRPYRMDPGLFRPLLGYGLPSMLTVLPQTLNLRLDQLLIAAFLPPRDLGLYVVAVAWSSATTPIVNGAGAVLFPRLSAILDPVEQLVMLSRVIIVIGCMVLGLTALSALLAPLAIPILFGWSFKEAVAPALILVLANGFSSLNFTLEDGLRGLGYPRRVLLAESLGVGMTIVLLWLLLPLLGISGAALASLGTYVIVCACLALLVMQVRLKHPSKTSPVLDDDPTAQPASIKSDP